MILASLLALAQMTQPLDDAAQMAALGKAMDGWKICTTKSVRHYALTTKEPAASVVEAAIGECSEDARAIRIKLMGLFNPQDTEEQMAFLLNHWRPKLTAGVFRLRSVPPKR